MVGKPGNPKCRDRHDNKYIVYATYIMEKQAYKDIGAGGGGVILARGSVILLAHVYMMALVTSY